MKILFNLYITFTLLVVSTNVFSVELLSAKGDHNQDCATESESPSTTPDSRFIDNGDGTISDSGTGLMWQKCSLGNSGFDCSIGNSPEPIAWQEAVDQAMKNTLAGYDDWRLPTLVELESIVERRCQSPSINLNFFLNVQGDYWTSDDNGDLFNQLVWNVDFSDGESDLSPPGAGVVRLVRYRH